MITQSLNKEEFKRLKPALQNIADAVQTSERVSGKTHMHYKYPAGFSPNFPKAVINAFSKPGDWVMDLFMGGATSILEANSMNRNAIGTDINELSVFCAKLKTLNLTQSGVSELELWMTNIVSEGFAKINDVEIPEKYQHYFELLPKSLAGFIYNAVNSTDDLKLESSRIFARGVVLRVCQLILDSRDFKPNIEEFILRFEMTFDNMMSQSNDHLKNLRKIAKDANLGFPQTILAHGDCTNEYFVTNTLKKADKAPSLIVTSPPYPGIHVLYNRWQIGGRKESSLPYFIIGSSQLETSSFYTMGNRSPRGIEQYFHSIWSVYTNIFDVVEKGTPVVQMLAFNNMAHQMEPFLEAMSNAGFEESRAFDVDQSPDGRIWRTVPNRKWYNTVSGSSSHSSNEVVLIHIRK